MLNSIINQYQHFPNFTHQITTKTHPRFYSLPAHTTQQLLISYTDGGTFVSRFYLTSSLHPGEFTFHTDLQEKIINSQTGEILGLFYGFNNPAFVGFMDQLIQSGQKFDLILKYSGTVTNILHGQYKQLKSGKWKKYR